MLGTEHSTVVLTALLHIAFKQYAVIQRSYTQPSAKPHKQCVAVSNPCLVLQESSRAQKRKQKVAAQGAEREARIAMELVEAGDSKRQLEEAALQELLLPLGFVVRDIQARIYIPWGLSPGRLEQHATICNTQNEPTCLNPRELYFGGP